MGFKTPDFPPVEPEEFLALPLMERTKILARHWGEYGFGTPKMIQVIYIVKLVVFYAFLGVVIACSTSGLHFWDVGEWFPQPIVLEKAVLWTVLLESMNFAGSWGPLAGKAKPMAGGIWFWGRPNTIRLRPWAWVPGTAGDRRTALDLVLYYALLISLVVALVLPGVKTDSVTAALAGQSHDAGLVNPVLMIIPIVLLVLNGLRDKIIFLGARGEQWMPVMIVFALFSNNYAHLIIGLKLVIFIVWVSAGFSKIGKHFSNVIPPMVSNAPVVPFKFVKRLHYKKFPEDMLPSKVAHFMAHVNGTLVEIAAPCVLFFVTNKWIAVAAAVLMVIFHLFIVSTFPLAVPLEWNVMFSYEVAFLFLVHGNWLTSGGDRTYYFTNMPLQYLIPIVVALLFFPVLGNLRPDKVSFLPSMRQYSGNWATAIWAFKPGTEDKLNRVTRPCRNTVEQFEAAGYPSPWNEIVLQMTIGWRTMHSQARGLFSLMLLRLPDINQRTVREGEFLCNSIVGFNFGDGHFHNAKMIKAVQDEAQFEPGEVLVAWVESEAFGSGIQRYQLIDPALGVIERGTWKVADAVKEQPWLPNGPIPVQVEWRAPQAAQVISA